MSKREVKLMTETSAGIKSIIRKLTGKSKEPVRETVVVNEMPTEEEMKMYEKEGVDVEVDPGLPTRDRGGFGGEEEER